MSDTTLKVVLTSGKTVLLRDPKIKHTELAAQAAAPKAQGAPSLLGMMMQKELLKILLITVDGVAISNNDKEDLDGLFTLSEYAQLMKAIDEISSGGEELGKARIEIVPSGDK